MKSSPLPTSSSSTYDKNGESLEQNHYHGRNNSGGNLNRHIQFNDTINNNNNSSSNVNGNDTGYESPNLSSSSSPSPPSLLKRSSSTQLFQQNNYEPFIFAQSLTSVCLDPTAPSQNEWSPNDLVIPPLSTSIPNITYQSFQPYLTKIASVYKIFKENQNKELIPTNRKTSEDLISLENIPEFFFKANLSKSQILEYANSDPSPILFQKLEHYSSIIEENIVGHVRDKSLDFFSAITDLKQFRGELNQLYNELINARQTLQKIDNDIVKKSLNITRLYLQKNRAIETLNKMTMVSDVKQAQPTLQLLLSKGDYGGALDLIQSTQYSLSNNLTTIYSLKNLSPQLSEMVKLIERMMEVDFIKIALNDELLLTSNQDDESEHDVKGDASDNQNNLEYNEKVIMDNINDMVIPIVSNLFRIGKVIECMESFKVEAIESVKSLFKSIVANVLYEIEYQRKPPSAQITSQFNWNECKSRLLKLSPTDSIPLFESIKKEFKKKMIIVKSIMERIISESYDEKYLEFNSPPTTSTITTSPTTITTPSSSSNIMDKRHKMESLRTCCNNIIINVNETIQECLSSLIKTRSEANAKLPLKEFVQLNNQLSEFIEFSETTILSQQKKKATNLRSIQLTQSKLFLETLHKHKLSHLSVMMENEDWIHVQVASEFQNIIDSLVNLSLNSPTIQSTPTTTTSQSNQQQQQQNDTIIISGEKFKVGNGTLMLLKFIDDYLLCIEKLPILVVDSIPKIVELLNTFNTMTYQLVLGAGARQLMKLKTISSKHLGLTSQCLSFTIKLIPYLKTILQRYLSSPNQYALLNGFDKLLQDFSGHRLEIFGKFTIIVKERSFSHLKALSTMDLRDDTLPIPTPPFAALLKDIMTLHKLLSELLPPDQIFKVFTNVYQMLNGLIIDSIQKFENLSSKAAKRRIHNDVLHLMASLRQLPSAGDPGPAIEDYLKSNLPI